MSAIISECGRYRYRLDRQCEGDGKTLVIMVNPSTADAVEDDLTITKVRGFGNRNKWGQIMVGNLFSFRATEIGQLSIADDPIGPENDYWLKDMIEQADRVVVAWGALERKLPEHLRSRWQHVCDMIPERLRPLLSIGPSLKGGHPRHPGRPSYSLPIIPWSLRHGGEAKFAGQ